jgi:hypothetical protein
MTVSAAALPVLLLSDLRLGLAQGAWWYVLAAVLALALAFAVYRYTLPPVSRLRRNVLWVLRAAALALLILLLFEPLLTYLVGRSRPPVVAVLVDNSASMAITGRSEDRAKVLRNLLAASELSALTHRAQVRAFAFADTLVELPFDSLAKLPLNGVGSDVAGAWTRAQKLLSAENLAAVVLISDGAYNLGENPVRVASASPVPVYTIGVGDTTGEADAFIAQITTNELVYTGSRVPVNVRVQAIGLAGKSSALRLLRADGPEIARQIVTFQGNESEAEAALSFEATAKGDLRLIAVLDSVPGETILQNNRRSVIVRVLERKATVFLLAGAPSADLTLLRQTFEADTTADVVTLVEARDGGFLYEATAPSAADLEKAGLFALCDFPTARSSQSLVETVVQAALQKRIPVLFQVGPHLSLSRLSALRPILPLESPRQALSDELVLTRAASSHPALTSSSPLPAEWSDLPPVYGGVGNFSVGGGGQVAVKLSREALGIAEDEPGLVLWEFGGRRAAAILCWGTARWKLQLAGNQSASEFYERLMSRLRAWLVAPSEEQRVKIRTSKHAYSSAEVVHFSAQVYGADLAPRDDASLELHVTSGSRSESVAMRSRGSGRYEGEFSPWATGEYRYAGRASVNSDTLGSDVGLFAVEPFNIELFDPRARYDILRQVARASKGSFAAAAQADTLLSRLKFEPRTVVTRREIALWRQGLLIWIIIALLALEWTVRKRSGML